MGGINRGRTFLRWREPQLTSADPGQSRIAYVDGLRGVAIALVLGVHYLPKVWLTAGGYLGVDIFFAVSGYVITQRLRTGFEFGDLTIRSFWIARLARLGPALGVVSVAAVLLETGLMRVSWSDAITQFITANTYTLTLFTYPTASAAWFVHTMGITWSLCVEAQFYVLWAWLLHSQLRAKSASISSLRIQAVCISLGSFGLLYLESRWLGAPGAPLTGSYTHSETRIGELTLGCLAALSGPPSRRLLRRCAWGTSLALGALAFFVACDSGAFGWGAVSSLYLAAFSTALLVYATPGSKVSTFLCSRPLQGLGRISYELYLWHVLAADAIAQAFDHPGVRIALPTATGASLILAGMTERWVTRPVRRYARARRHRPNLTAPQDS